MTGAVRQYTAGHELCFDLAGRTRLAEAVDLLSLATAVVSNDSGLMHIAAALARPLVVIYGATSPGFTPPLNANAAIVASAIDCAPCFQRECPLVHHRCMRDTRVEQVAGALDTLLAACDATRFVDLNLRPPWISGDVVEKSLTAANIVKLSEEELRSIAPILELFSVAGDEAIARQLAQRFAIDMIVVTCGARGAWCLYGELVQRVAAVPANTTEGDAVGAGDAFSAICILGHLLHWDMPSTLDRAAAFAAAICGIRGPVPESSQFYSRFKKAWRLEHN